MDPIRDRIIEHLQGGALLQLAYVGVVDGLFEALAGGERTASQLAEAADVDAGYVVRWCDAAFAFELLDANGDAFSLSELGERFRPSAPGTLMPFAVQSVLGAHMAERAAGLMPSGERPGESVLAERETVMPWFGPMLEHSFGALFESQILDAVGAFARTDERRGLVVDLGCGNGWYLRALARHFPNIRGIGLDGFDANIDQAKTLAEHAGVADRLDFRHGDLHDFTVDEPVDLIAMNRALHHVWSEKENVFRILREHLVPGGAAVIWEPRWPDDRTTLRTVRARGMAFQNLAEHVQGNHFLRPDEIAAAFEAGDFTAEIHLFAEGHEAVVVGTRR